MRKTQSLQILEAQNAISMIEYFRRVEALKATIEAKDAEIAELSNLDCPVCEALREQLRQQTESLKIARGSENLAIEQAKKAEALTWGVECGYMEWIGERNGHIQCKKAAIRESDRCAKHLLIDLDTTEAENAVLKAQVESLVKHCNYRHDCDIDIEDPD